MLLIIIHEFGHFITAYFFNWKIDKIYIYPLGGITRFNDLINKPFIEEFLVLLMGPVFQIVGACLLHRIDNNAYIYSNYLLLFNFLPIVPLDGGRLLTIIFSLLIPYKKALDVIIYLSFSIYIALISYIFINGSFTILIICLFLIIKIIEEKKNNKYIFKKYILERYLYEYRFKNKKVITNFNEMYKYKSHLFKINNKYYSEKEYLNVIG